MASDGMNVEAASEPSLYSIEKAVAACPPPGAAPPTAAGSPATSSETHATHPTVSLNSGMRTLTSDDNDTTWALNLVARPAGPAPLSLQDQQQQPRRSARTPVPKAGVGKLSVKL
jgi:hypothetical protein